MTTDLRWYVYIHVRKGNKDAAQREIRENELTITFTYLVTYVKHFKM